MAGTLEKMNTTALDRIQKKRIQMGGDMKLIKRNPLANFEIIHYSEEVSTESKGKKGLVFRFIYKGNDTIYDTSGKTVKEVPSPYASGYYIGEILLHTSYPSKAGDIRMLTPNGRFEAGNKICMDNTAFHQGDLYAGSKAGWNISSILTGFESIWLDDKECGIAHITPAQHSSRGIGGAPISNLKKFRTECAKNSVQYNATHLAHYFKKFSKYAKEYSSRLPSDFKLEIDE